jgi:DNA-binding response OmpR family regulator
MPRHKIKVLIIDYEPRGIKQLSDPLLQAGFLVEVAKDGLSGIQAFNTHKPDLTLIEAMLPKKHGFEVCQELKNTPHGAMTPVVIVTSVYKGRKYRTQALHHYGCDEYLEKPIPADVLVQTIRRLLRERAPVGSASPPDSDEGDPDPQSASSGPPADPAMNAGPSAARGPEREIIERLDEILPDGTSPTGSASPGAGPTRFRAEVPDEKVLSFDPDRARRRRVDRSTTPPGAQSAPRAPLGRTGSAQPASLVQSIQEEAATKQPAAHVEASPRVMTRPHRDLEPQTAPRRWWLWGILVVAAVAGSVAVFLMST